MEKTVVLFLLLLSVCDAAVFGRAFNRNKVSSIESLKPASAQNGHNFCTEASVTMFYYNFGGVCYTSSNLMLFEQNNATYLRISNVTGSMSYFNLPLIKIYYQTSNDLIDTNYNSSMPYDFLLDKEDPYIYIKGLFAKSIYSDGYSGSVSLVYGDGGTLTNIDGTYFDETNPCTTTHDKCLSSVGTIFYEYNQTICCKNFSPAPPTPSDIPKCKRFRSRSILYNNDFSSIHATSAMNFTLINNQLITDGDFDNSSDLVRVHYEINNGFLISFFSDGPQGLNHNVSLPTGDFKLIFSMNFVLPDFGNPLPNIGKLILQNDRTFMDEGVPFTPDNNCWYNQHNINGHKVATSEFCCKEFE